MLVYKKLLVDLGFKPKNIAEILNNKEPWQLSRQEMLGAAKILRENYLWTWVEIAKIFSMSTDHLARSVKKFGVKKILLNQEKAKRVAKFAKENPDIKLYEIASMIGLSRETVSLMLRKNGASRGKARKTEKKRILRRNMMSIVKSIGIQVEMSTKYYDT